MDDEAVGRYNSLTLGSDGAVYLAAGYFFSGTDWNETAIHLYTYLDGNWSYEVVEYDIDYFGEFYDSLDAMGDNISLSLDAAGNQHLVYQYGGFVSGMRCFPLPGSNGHHHFLVMMRFEYLLPLHRPH